MTPEEENLQNELDKAKEIYEKRYQELSARLEEFQRYSMLAQMILACADAIDRIPVSDLDLVSFTTNLLYIDSSCVRELLEKNPTAKAGLDQCLSDLKYKLRNNQLSKALSYFIRLDLHVAVEKFLRDLREANQRFESHDNSDFLQKLAEFIKLFDCYFKEAIQQQAREQAGQRIMMWQYFAIAGSDAFSGRLVQHLTAMANIFDALDQDLRQLQQCEIRSDRDRDVWDFQRDLSDLEAAGDDAFGQYTQSQWEIFLSQEHVCDPGEQTTDIIPQPQTNDHDLDESTLKQLGFYARWGRMVANCWSGFLEEFNRMPNSLEPLSVVFPSLSFIELTRLTRRLAVGQCLSYHAFDGCIPILSSQQHYVPYISKTYLQLIRLHEIACERLRFADFSDRVSTIPNGSANNQLREDSTVYNRTNEAKCQKLIDDQLKAVGLKAPDLTTVDGAKNFVSAIRERLLAVSAQPLPPVGFNGDGIDRTFEQSLSELTAAELQRRFLCIDETTAVAEYIATLGLSHFRRNLVIWFNKCTSKVPVWFDKLEDFWPVLLEGEYREYFFTFLKDGAVKDKINKIHQEPASSGSVSSPHRVSDSINTAEIDFAQAVSALLEASEDDVDGFYQTWYGKGKCDRSLPFKDLYRALERTEPASKRRQVLLKFCHIEEIMAGDLNKLFHLVASNNKDFQILLNRIIWKVSKIGQLAVLLHKLEPERCEAILKCLPVHQMSQVIESAAQDLQLPWGDKLAGEAELIAQDFKQIHQLLQRWEDQRAWIPWRWFREDIVASIEKQPSSLQKLALIAKRKAAQPTACVAQSCQVLSGDVDVLRRAIRDQIYSKFSHVRYYLWLEPQYQELRDLLVKLNAADDPKQMQTLLKDSKQNFRTCVKYTQAIDDCLALFEIIQQERIQKRLAPRMA